MKKIISLILVFIITLTSITSALASDVPDSWASSGVDSAKFLKLIPVNMQNNYRKNITREEFCELVVVFLEKHYNKEMLDILFEKDLPKKTNIFTDTENINIILCYSAGIVSGVSKTKFEPNKEITREQAAVMIANMSKMMGENVDDFEAYPNFKDANLISNWAYNGVDFVVKNKIMLGFSPQTFSPQTLYTRQQAYMTFDNAYKYFQEDARELASVSVSNKIVRIGQGENYVASVFGEPIDKFQSLYGFEWNVYNTDYSDFIMIGMENEIVKAIATNSFNFKYDNKIDTLTPYSKIKADDFTNENQNVKFLEYQKHVEGIFVLAKGVVRNNNPINNSYSNTAKENFYFVNSFRVKNGLKPLKHNKAMYDVALSHSKDMAENNFFSHTGSDGVSASSRIEKAIPNLNASAENVTYGFENGFEAFTNFINSSSHRDNILDVDFSYFESATFAKPDGTLYMTQVFTDY